VFNNAGSSAYAINPVRCHNLTAIGNVNTTGFASGYAVNPSGTTQKYFFFANNVWDGDYNVQTIKGASTFADPLIPVAGWSGRHVANVVPITYSASMTPDAALGNRFEIVVTNGTAFTINNPTNAASGSVAEGQEITIWIANTSGGAHGTITLGGNFKTAGALPAIATGNNRAFRFAMRLGEWLETSRSPADVPN